MLLGALGAACEISVDSEPLPGSAPSTEIEPVPAPAPAPEGKPDPAILVIDRTAYDFGMLHVPERSDELVLTVRNGGPKPVSGLTLHLEQEIGFTVTATTCAGWLEPSATCTIAIVFAPAHAGAVETEFVVQAGNLVARTTLAGTGAATLRILNHVVGYQVEVISEPAGITCGAICEALFTTHEVILDKGSFDLAAWSGPCEPITESTCLLRLERDTTIELQLFEPGLLWSESTNEVTSLTTDPDNNVIVSGYNETGLVKYSPEGELLWQTNAFGTAHDVAVDALGNIGLINEYDRRTLRKLDDAGNLLWNIETSPFEAGLARLAFDPSGNLHVAGTVYSWGDGTYSSRVHKYDPSGALLWTIDYAPGWPISVRDMAVDRNGNVLVLVNEVHYSEDGSYNPQYSLRKYDGDGGLMWTITESGEGSSVAVDTTSNIFLSSFAGGGLIEKRAPDGTHLWLASVTEPGVADWLAVTAAGDVITLGSRQFGDGDNDWETWAVKIDGANGEQQQGRIRIRTEHGAAWVSGFAVDGQGALVIGGQFYSYDFRQGWLRKYDGAVLD